MSAYLSLTKPRMVLANVLVAAAAFVFGSPAVFDWASFALMAAGLALVIASGCALNNYWDRGIDARMARTQSRALPAGRVPPRAALWLGAALLPLGLLLMAPLPWALVAALGGWIWYVLFYTPLKHHSSLALYVGAVAGATPPVVGYAAAAGRIDLVALALFAVLFLWQLPHFWAIAVYRFDEYAAAGVPLIVRRNPAPQARRRARIIFYASLAALLVFCAALMLQRWMR